MIILKNENYNIFDELKRNAVNNQILFQAEFDVTYACSSNCFFCFQGKKHDLTRKPMSKKKCIEVMRDLRELGCYYIGFSGGEPFCREDFLELVKEAKKLGFLISIITNLQIPNENDLYELAEIGVDRITVSVHSIFPENYAKIFKVNQDVFYKVIHNIDYLVYNKCSVGIAVTVTDRNYSEMVKIKEYFLQHNLEEKNINYNMLIQGKNDIKGNRNICLLCNYLNENKHLKENILENKENPLICSAGRTSCCITPYGDITPCSFFNASAGNIYDSSLKDIWNNSHLLKIIRNIHDDNFDYCKNCSNLSYCHICLANNMNETNNPFIPSHAYCEYRKGITNSLI